MTTRRAPPRFRRVVRVRYPAEPGDLWIRVQSDDGSRTEPRGESPEPGLFEFEVLDARPFVYVQPVLRTKGRARRSPKRHLVTLTPEHPRDIYPAFFADGRGTISPIQEVPSPRRGLPFRLRVYLPPGYGENPLKRYPVVTMHDGKNLFFPDEAFLGKEWEVDETMDLLDSMSLIDKAVVVGVHSGEERRDDEYTLPGYETFGAAVVEDLLPWAASSYRLLGGTRASAVMGSSLGGVLAFYMAWEWPEHFGAAACLSSTFSWRDDLVERVLTEPPRPVRIYLDSGWPGDNYEVTMSMAMALRHRGWSYGRDVLYFAFPNATHGEESWAERLHIPFQYLLGRAGGATTGPSTAPPHLSAALTDPPRLAEGEDEG